MERQYKDSGIEWIGRIPEGWKMSRIKQNISFNPGRKEMPFNSRVSFMPMECLRFNQIERRTAIYGKVMNYTPFENGDIVMAKVTPCFENGNIAIAEDLENGVGFGTSEIFVIRATDNVQNKYLFYYLTIPYIINRGVSSMTGTGGLKRVNPDYFLTSILLLPPLPEQQRIASYLDKKCGEIDELIALQEKMIAQLTEYKQAVITEAVTKGLDPNAKLVPSGIEWIGDVPEGWSIIKVGFIFDNLDYLREPISAELRERNNPQYDYYGASGVIDRIDHYNVDDKVLLIGEDGANLVMRNLPLIYKAEGKFWVNNHAHILKPKKDDYDFMALALEAADYHDYITGSAQPKLSQENLQAVKIPVPPLPEQQRIASYLDTKCSEIDSLIALKRQKIESLNAYKKSIIYEAVTGKTII